MRWEDQELNHGVPENKFPEVFFTGLFLLGYASKRKGRFVRIDQQMLDDLVANDELPRKASGCRIDRLCLYYRLSCRLGPGGDHYPVLGTTHFWETSKSLYAILYISPKNDWFHIMVIAAEAPNEQAGADGRQPSGSSTSRASVAAASHRSP
jgi:hypothetical protein